MEVLRTRFYFMSCHPVYSLFSATLFACVADLSMLYWIRGLTGGNGAWRCMFKTARSIIKYLRPSCHVEKADIRSDGNVAEQWTLAMWCLAIWTVRYGGRATFQQGELVLPCDVCRNKVQLSAELVQDSGMLYCRSPSCLRSGRPITLLHTISQTIFSFVVNAARHLAGGVRGFPLLHGLHVRLQIPVLHCTGSLAKAVLLFVIACLPGAIQEESKGIIRAITGMSAVDKLYLQEYREMVAHGVARPSISSKDLDVFLIIMLQLLQLVNASWRSSLNDADAPARAGAAVITRIAVSVLEPLFMDFKPLELVTKDAKVVSLYLHAPIANLHELVRSNRAPVAYVADETIEGHLRGLVRYL